MTLFLNLALALILPIFLVLILILRLALRLARRLALRPALRSALCPCVNYLLLESSLDLHPSLALNVQLNCVLHLAPSLYFFSILLQSVTSGMLFHGYIGRRSHTWYKYLVLT